MNFFIRSAIFFYVFVITLAGVTALLVLAHVIDVNQYLDFVKFVYVDEKAGLLTAVVIAVIMLTSLVLARIIFGRQHQERLIHFENPLGRVTISLSAIEDLIRRLVVHTPQIREIRPDISSTKNGLNVDIRLVLHSDANIPEMTAELQSIIKRKIQDVVGNDEQVNISVHVVKIATDTPRKGRGNDEDEQAGLGSAPFRGYRV